MGLFNFFSKNNEAEIDKILKSDFGTYADVLCNPFRTFSKLCNRFDCTTSFALCRGPLNGNTYSLALIAGELYNSDDRYYWLRQVFSEDEDARIADFERFGFTEQDAHTLSLGNLAYFPKDDSDTIEFSSEDFMSYLPASESRYHLKAFGRILHKAIPDAYISVDNTKIFVMLNGSAQGVYEEK